MTIPEIRSNIFVTPSPACLAAIRAIVLRRFSQQFPDPEVFRTAMAITVSLGVFHRAELSMVKVLGEALCANSEDT